MNPHELVLCVPTEVFGDLLGYESLNKQGFNLHQPSARVKRLREYFKTNGPLWKKRGSIEENEKFQQLIPYVIVTAGRNSLLTYQRGSKGHEKRLHAKRSVGIGGHVNPCDVKGAIAGKAIHDGKTVVFNGGDPLRALLYTAALRELQEELKPVRPFILRNLSVRGFIRTNEAPVAKVHVGVVFEYRFAGMAPALNPAPEIQDLKFLTAQEVRETSLSPISFTKNGSPKDRFPIYEQWSMELMPALRRDFAVV